MATTSSESILTTGKHAALRIWRNEEPSAEKPDETRPYETLGYIISGAMNLTVDGNTRMLKAGDSYLVPEGASHRYVITETLTAVEAVSPAPQAS